MPHVGSATVRTRAKMAAMAVDNLLAALDGRPMPTRSRDADRRRRHRDELDAPLVAEVDGDGLRELARDSIVTRLGEGVEASGRLGDEPQARVFAALDGFAEGSSATAPRSAPRS